MFKSQYESDRVMRGFSEDKVGFKCFSVSEDILSNSMAVIHFGLFKYTLIKQIKWKLQFLIHTSHILSIQIAMCG